MSDWYPRLTDAADKLRQVEKTYYQAVAQLLEAKHQCNIKESELIAANKVNMKNPETRQADLWKLAKEDRKNVMKAEMSVDALKAELHYRQNMFESISLAAKLAAETK